jgi:hypothetical protein
MGGRLNRRQLEGLGGLLDRGPDCCAANCAGQEKEKAKTKEEALLRE